MEIKVRVLIFSLKILLDPFHSQVFPQEIFQLKALRELQYAGNALKELPEKIGVLENLHVSPIPDAF